IVADVLTIPIDQISVVFGDTLLVQHGGGTSGSRSMALGGSAAYLASQEVREQIFGVAAGLLEAAKGDLALANATGGVRGAAGPAAGVAPGGALRSARASLGVWQQARAGGVAATTSEAAPAADVARCSASVAPEAKTASAARAAPARASVCRASSIIARTRRP